MLRLLSLSLILWMAVSFKVRADCKECDANYTKCKKTHTQGYCSSTAAKCYLDSKCCLACDNESYECLKEHSVGYCWSSTYSCYETNKCQHPTYFK